MSVKGRDENKLNFKKPAVWVVTAFLALAAVLTVDFLSNRPPAGAPSNGEAYDFLTLEDVRALAQKGESL